jgi:two-component system LytT family response regulator
MNKITVIIIDDERASREELKLALLQYDDFSLLAEATSADQAKELIDDLQPDLIFLDIEMPGKSGFDLLESMNNVPSVIFTTAYHQYAVKAFEVNALDYLLKPIREERFKKAIEKVRDNESRHSFIPEKNEGKIFIKDGEKCFFILLNDIYLIESLDNYTRLWFGNNKAIQRRSLRQWEELLDENTFFRINREAIVNLQHIKNVSKLSSGRLKVKLEIGQELEVSSRQSAKFKSLNRL